MAGIEDLIDDIQDGENQIEINTGIGKKKKKLSILDELVVGQEQQETANIPVAQQQIVEPEIVEPEPLQTTIDEKIQQQLVEQNKQYQQQQRFQNQKQQRFQQIENDVVIQEAKQELEQIRGEELPDNINIVETEKQLDEALSEIPDGNEHSIIDVKITVSTTKKDKTGYYKTKVSLGKGKIPEQINVISSYVKKNSKGLIKPRICDLRLIGNTNKTQLRGSSLKLSSKCIVYKPDPKKLKVNKGTRFMISIPEDYDSTGNLLVYIQESRDKTIMELTAKDFPDVDSFNKFIGDRIIEYYTVGYSISLKKLELRNVTNPVMSVITEILKTNDFKAKPYTSDNHIYAVDFYNKDSSKNPWLYVSLVESDTHNRYDIFAKNKVDESFEWRLTDKLLTIDMLIGNLYDVLLKVYNMDWSDKLAIDDEDKIYYILGKLKHSRLKQAVHVLSSENVQLAEALSKDEASKRLEESYDAECVIGKTESTDYFILTYLAYPIIGGDKRKSADYITTESYREKYGIKTERDVVERSKILKSGEERNYNARKYMFQLEYKVGDKKNTYRSIDFDKILNDTGILTEDVKFPESKY